MFPTRDKYHEIISGRARGWSALAQRGGLRMASWPYGMGVRLRNKFYDWRWKKSHRVPVPVISIGNLTLGGTGKTPCVEYVARLLREQDRRVVLLSRGYGNQGGRNDEAMVLEENLPDVPHLQSPDRVEIAQIALEELEADVLVLDDGFQHRRIERDLNIVLIDATEPWGYGALFPRGLLREPKSSLRRAHMIVLTRCDLVERAALDRLALEVRGLAGQAPIVRTRHMAVELINSEGMVLPLDALEGRPTAAFCGIGNPDGFRRGLEVLGAVISSFRAFPDHHPYQREDVDDLGHWAAQSPADSLVLTTQKDLVKIRLGEMGRRPVWALRICLTVDQGKEAFDGAILSTVHRAVAGVS